ncbi:hypothetical protein PV327_008311 [Microctonus hyperodae]|uniref:Pro-resilin n=1 Tax=Microctonus hyperodae TaxID=165561 RepID=A0AA39F2U1_MICHY|nr:hypothetical protein PV327_008311 [Microctonus hyperodae]
MTGRTVDAFAVKHPSNQAFTNEGLRTSYSEARARTQFEYANDVEKYDDDDCADDNNGNKKSWRKINYQIKSSIGNNERKQQRSLLLIEKTNERWPDYYFKIQNCHLQYVYLHQLFLNIIPINLCIFNRKYYRKFNFDFYLNKFSTPKLSANYNKFNNFTQRRKTRETHRLYDAKSKAKLIYRMSHDDSITLIPTTKLDRVLSKLFQESLRQDESLTNIHGESSMSNVKINLPSIRVVDDTQSGVTRNPVKSSNSQSEVHETKFHINKITKFSVSATDEMKKLNIHELMRTTNKFINSIESFDLANIHRLHRELNRNTMPILGLNFHRLQPQQFVLAPTKFVDNIKILPGSLALIHSHQSNAVKGILNKQNNANFNSLNEAMIKHNNAKRKFFNSTSNIDFFPPATSLPVQITQSNNSPSLSTPNQSESMINLMKINRQQKPNSPLNHLRYAEKYDFAYRVTDDKTRNDFGHRESRNEGVTNGHYHVLLPDGRIQEVEYRVDKSDGYRANVTYHNQVYG